MAAVHDKSGWLPTLGTLARLVGSELRSTTKQTFCWVVLCLGLGNLLAGLIVGAGDWLPTFVALDVIYANFGCAPWIVAVYLGSQPPQARFDRGVAAKVSALAIVVAVMLAAAGTVAIDVQLWRGSPSDVSLYAAGLYANLGVSTLHLIALAVAMQAIVGRKWLAMAATAVVWIGTNLGFEHPLLRFGAPISPASGMNGFGPFVASEVALGIHWTGCCVVLIAIGRQIAGRRSARAGGSAPHPLGPNVFAVVWTAAVGWVVSGGWILHDASLGKDPRVGRNAQAAGLDPPQPVYSRLALDTVISPLERVLVSRGTAIAVNSLDVPIPELHFGIPPVLEVVSLRTTGKLVGKDKTTACHRYRLNRPLEPKETLKIEFDLKWIPESLGHGRATTRLLENGTFVSTADILPTLGCPKAPHAFRSAPPVAFRARIGTSLNQIAVTAGSLVRAWKENGWSYFEYETEEPISPFTTIHSGHYATRREVRNETLVEVFYHPDHRDNIDRMIDAGLAALENQPASASGRGPIRIVEVPDYRPFRRLGFLGFGQTRQRVDEVAGLVLPYSERAYPLNTPPPSESTRPRA